MCVPIAQIRVQTPRLLIMPSDFLFLVISIGYEAMPPVYCLRSGTNRTFNHDLVSRVKPITKQYTP